MDSIMRSWNEKGLHTVRDISERDGAPRRRIAPAAQQSSGEARSDELERMRRLYDKVKNGERR